MLDANNISFDTKDCDFNVKGPSGVTRVVFLFPWLTCNSLSNGDCCHKIEAKLCTGMPTSTNTEQKRKVTQLQRNTRSKKEKSNTFLEFLRAHVWVLTIHLFLRHTKLHIFCTDQVLSHCDSRVPWVLYYLKNPAGTETFVRIRNVQCAVKTDG